MTILKRQFESKNFRPILLIGKAGTGKTTCVNACRSLFGAAEVVCSATTGAAASLYGGPTIHFVASFIQKGKYNL